MTRMPARGQPPPHALILESERLFLLDLLRSPDGTAAMASAPKPYDRRPFTDGGRWRGDVPKSLVRRGIIAPVTTAGGAEAEPAARPSRNRTCLRRWRLIDRDAARRRLAVLNARRKGPNDRTLFDDLADGPVP